MLDAKELLRKVECVRPVSDSARRLLALMGKPNHQMADLVRIIEYDPALTANLLRIANSAAYGLKRRLATVAEAAVYLGELNIIGIALAASGFEIFNAELKGYEGTRGELGRHCLATAFAAREISVWSDGRVDEGLAFTAGLLHDVGKVVISDYLEGTAHDLVERLSNREVPEYLTAERQLLGTDHAAVGGMLARHWRLPEALQAGIEGHHTPAAIDQPWRPLAYVVHLADMLAMLAGYGAGADAIQYALDRGYTEYIQLTSERLDIILLGLQVDFARAAEALFGELVAPEA